MVALVLYNVDGFKNRLRVRDIAIDPTATLYVMTFKRNKCDATAIKRWLILCAIKNVCHMYLMMTDTNNLELVVGILY